MSSPANDSTAGPNWKKSAQKRFRQLIQAWRPPQVKLSEADLLAAMRAALKNSATPVGEPPQPEPDRVFMMRSAARSTQIVGHMLDTIAREYSLTTKPAAFIVRVGRIAWAVVEAAVPRSVARLLMQYWFSLLVIAELLLIAGGTLIPRQSAAQELGVKLLALTLGIRILIEITRLYLGRTNVRRILTWFLVVVALLFVWGGVVHFRKEVAPDLKQRAIVMKDWVWAKYHALCTPQPEIRK